MQGRSKKGQREKDLTSRYMSGRMDEDQMIAAERFAPSHKLRQQQKIARTALVRSEEASGIDIQTLPIGQVIQVHSRYCEVRHEERTYLAVVRRTLTKASEGYVVVGDRVRFRKEIADAPRNLTAPLAADSATVAPPEVCVLPPALASLRAETRGTMATAVIEQILERQTILTRADSFKAREQHPIVANAQQMLIVASVRMPRVKWGLIDRMLVAAQSGNLPPVVCLNKMDLIGPEDEGDDDVLEAQSALAHYESIGVRTLQTSVEKNLGIDKLRALLAGCETVLAGHSGVGKSSVINSIQPSLNLRIGDISRFNDKGRHTTTSARRYPLEAGGSVIDTPGVKMFGLWNLTAEKLGEYFPDISAGTAPPWRQESFERIKESLGRR